MLAVAVDSSSKHALSRRRQAEKYLQNCSGAPRVSSSQQSTCSALQHTIGGTKSNDRNLAYSRQNLPRMVLSTALLPTEAFNHKTLRLQIQPARYPQMRPQHHVQPLTNPPGHAQEPHERYRCKTTTKPTAATHQPPATETALEGAQEPSKTLFFFLSVAFGSRLYRLKPRGTG